MFQTRRTKKNGKRKIIGLQKRSTKKKIGGKASKK